MRLHYEALNRVVKDIDPELLTCEGIYFAAGAGRDYSKGTAFDGAASGDQRCPASALLLSSTPLDFLDIHAYPGWGNKYTAIADTDKMFTMYEQSSLLDQAEKQGVLARKPLVMGEFGTLTSVDPDFGQAKKRLVALRDTACKQHGFTGFLMWTIDCFEQSFVQHAMMDGTEFLKELNRVPYWPASGKVAKPANEKETVVNPLLLAPVTPTGEGKGFLVHYSLD